MIYETEHKGENVIVKSKNVNVKSYRYPDVPCPQTVEWIEEQWGEFTK